MVNFHDFQLFRTTNPPKIGRPRDKALYGYVDTTGKFHGFNSETLISSNIKLSCIPDKLIISARKTQSRLKCSDPDTYLAIKKLRINFNNQAGISSTYTTEQLYDASVQSGLANLTYREFVGNTIGQGHVPLASALDNPVKYNAWPLNPYAGQGSVDASQGIKMIPLTRRTGFDRAVQFRGCCRC